ncbi:hypothetical protein Syun_009726 [Stephania yunnanensis]|uniref:Uncharacterized protein n=1 Tax=Stephania yunnanensis TaxID=152371 RepID=A0AAP0PPA9_9MAGN
MAAVICCCCRFESTIKLQIISRVLKGLRRFGEMTDQAGARAQRSSDALGDPRLGRRLAGDSRFVKEFYSFFNGLLGTNTLGANPNPLWKVVTTILRD